MKLSEKKLQELKDKKNSIEDLNDQYFVRFDSQHEIEAENLKLLNENICSFQKIVDKFKSIKDADNDPCLYKLLRNKELFEELIQNNKLNTEDLRYLLNRIDEGYELGYLIENTTLLMYIVDNELFQEFVDKFKSTKDVRNDPCLYKLLENKKFFENNRLNEEDLRYLLNKIDKWYELAELCDTIPLINEILNEFILNKEDVDKFNTLIENDEWYKDKDRDIHTIFDLIAYYNKNNEEVLKLNELNEKVYMLNNFDLTKDQKLEIHEILRNNEQAQSLLKQLVDSNLEDQYDFDTLKRILTKEDKKKKITLNF